MTYPVLITGASRGLGAAMALALSPKFHIIAVAKTTGALEELDDAIKAKGGEATLAPMDVTNTDAMRHLCRSIHDRWGGVSIWCHTAIHAAALTPTHQLTAKDWDKSLKVNAVATGQLIPFVAPLLGAKGQAMFFDDPTPGSAFLGAYGASKAAQMTLARSWQAETAKIGPKVHIVTPAPMPTALRARFHPGENREALADPKNEAARIVAETGLLD